jgi:hypothetical protein
MMTIAEIDERALRPESNSPLEFTTLVVRHAGWQLRRGTSKAFNLNALRCLPLQSTNTPWRSQTQFIATIS